MGERIRIGIVGYGNIGRCVERSVMQNSDMELKAVFTRRDPKVIGSKVSAVSLSDIEKYKGTIDVMILCGGSATDLPEQGPELAAMFNTVDSFDTHARIPEYFSKMDEAARKNGNLCLISTGWDPGLFSMIRLLGEAVLPVGSGYTFWGKGVSQGHSDAIRRVRGVRNGIQYTVPIEEALNRVRAGENPQFSSGDMHERICYVVPEEGADLEQIENDIKNMPNYFADYKTTVHFITQEELKANHSAMPHGGFVIRTGITGDNTKQLIEFKLELGSNPEFTANVLVASARAVHRLWNDGKRGACTMFDIPLGYLSPKSAETLRKELL